MAVPGAPPDGPEPLSFEEWQQQRDVGLALANRPVAVSAMRLAEEAARAARLGTLTLSRRSDGS